MKRFFVLPLFVMLLLNGRVNAQYWKALGGGVDGGGLVEALMPDTFHHKLFAGGVFNVIGGVSANYLAYWDGNAWHSLPVQPSDPVIAFAMKEDTLIFITANSNDFQVGRYVDTNFIDTLTKPGGAAYCLYVLHDTLYAGGEFSGGIKYWTGTQWKKLGGGVGGFLYSVNAIGEFNNQLIVGGHFSDANGLSVNNIASWDGIQWNDMNGGVTNEFVTPYVYTLDIYNSKLYVGGDFDHSSGIHTGSIATWDGSNWDTVLLSSFGTSCGIFYDFYSDDSVFYVTGSISGGAGCMGDLAAEFDGENWSNLHLGVANSGRAITVFDGTPISGGDNKFGYDGDTLNYIAKFLGYPTTVSETTDEQNQIIYPNPAQSQLNITLATPSEENSIQVFDLYGRMISLPVSFQNGKTELNIETLTEGLYNIQITDKRSGKVEVGKFVKSN